MRFTFQNRNLLWFEERLKRTMEAIKRSSILLRSAADRNYLEFSTSDGRFGTLSGHNIFLVGRRTQFRGWHRVDEFIPCSSIYFSFSQGF